jgi:tRNA G18 (ribose-2'-O)-methylase SpoU
MDLERELYRGVSDRELLRTHRLFVAEGRLVVRRVIESGSYRIRSLLVNAAARRELAESIERLAPEVPVMLARTSEFRDLTGFNIHRGCLALVEHPPARSVDDLLARDGPVVMLEGVSNADNVGGIFRNAAAFGAAGLVLDERSCDPFYRKAVRTSMAAVLTMPFARAAGWHDALTRVRAAGFFLAALTPRMMATPIADLTAHLGARRVALVLGAEGAGLSDATIGTADAAVRIPMAKGVDSLNVSVAAGIALYLLNSRGCA